MQMLVSGAHAVFESGVTGADFYVQASAAVNPVQNFRVFGNGRIEIKSVATQDVRIMCGATTFIQTNATGIGFNGSAPTAKGNITGSRSDLSAAGALGQLLDFLALRGDFSNNSTA